MNPIKWIKINVYDKIMDSARNEGPGELVIFFFFFILITGSFLFSYFRFGSGYIQFMFNEPDKDHPGDTLLLVRKVSLQDWEYGGELHSYRSVLIDINDGSSIEGEYIGLYGGRFSYRGKIRGHFLLTIGDDYGVLLGARGNVVFDSDSWLSKNSGKFKSPVYQSYFQNGCFLVQLESSERFIIDPLSNKSVTPYTRCLDLPVSSPDSKCRIDGKTLNFKGISIFNKTNIHILMPYGIEYIKGHLVYNGNECLLTDEKSFFVYSKSRLGDNGVFRIHMLNNKGKEIWNTKIDIDDSVPTMTFFPPAFIHNGKIIVKSRSHITAYDLINGRLLWEN